MCVVRLTIKINKATKTYFMSLRDSDCSTRFPLRVKDHLDSNNMFALFLYTICLLKE